MKIKLLAYKTAKGEEPFSEWLLRLKDAPTRRRILQRLRRVESGNFGDAKTVGSGVYELRLFFGAGYRVYYGREGDVIVVLLCGGDKSTQDDDITRAKQYWKDYNDDLPHA